MKTVVKASITKAHISSSVDAKPAASPVASEWLASIRKPPLATKKRPSQFGSPNPVQKVKQW